ncbi:MAG: hypothetical protein KAQ67_12645, partial [Gammaproteobacteria bacterium]|nr:hypothetical protein [Gammaproteobacteria bacterium]
MSDVELEIKETGEKIRLSFNKDKVAFKRRLKKIREQLKSKHSKNALDSLQRLKKQVEFSSTCLHKKRQQLPKISFPENLPITA